MSQPPSSWEENEGEGGLLVELQPCSALLIYT